MEKAAFKELIDRIPDNSTEEDCLAVLSLKKKYPYSQLLHTLSARLSRDHNLASHLEELQSGAVHASDRILFKHIVTQDSFFQNLVKGKKTGEIQPISKPAIPTKTVLPEKLDLADELLKDLKILKLKKDAFEATLDALERQQEIKGEIKEEVKLLEKQPVLDEKINKTVSPKKEKTTKKAKGKDKKQRIIELAKELREKESDQISDSSQENEGEPEKSKLNVKQEFTEEIIENIESNRKKIDPKLVKHKDQLKLIDEFIKNQASPTSSRFKPTTSPQGDLTTLKSAEFGDHIVSETLVEILVKQGKKDKAIEVLKKLIWKFPQKKAYFAAQIEDLKK